MGTQRRRRISVSRNSSPLLWREQTVQDSSQAHAALRQQLLDDPLALDATHIFWRVHLGVVALPRSFRPLPHLIFNRGASTVVVLVGIGIDIIVAHRKVEVGGPHDVAVELVDRGRPRVRAESGRVARPWWAVDPTTMWAARRCEHELWPRLGGGRARALEPRVRLVLPACRAAADANALPDDAANEPVVDRAAQGRFEGGHGKRLGVVVRSGAEQFGDYGGIPDRVEV
jgi:hypothetical protein